MLRKHSRKQVGFHFLFIFEAKCEHLIRAENEKTGLDMPYDQVNSKAVMMARELRPRLKAVQ